MAWNLKRMLRSAAPCSLRSKLRRRASAAAPPKKALTGAPRCRSPERYAGPSTPETRVRQAARAALDVLAAIPATHFSWVLLLSGWGGVLVQGEAGAGGAIGFISEIFLPLGAGQVAVGPRAGAIAPGPAARVRKKS
jgi:hypothetical protein